MPKLKGVSVDICCPIDLPSCIDSYDWAGVQGYPLMEHGNHKLRNRPVITTYIMAITNCPFAIAINMCENYERTVKDDVNEILSARIYIDGREHENSGCLVFPNQETWISSIFVEHDDGQVEEKGFVFREVGLENVFNRLHITNGMAANTKQNIRNQQDVESSPPSAGQIRIDIARVRMADPLNSLQAHEHILFNRTDQFEARMSDLDIPDDASHTTG
jgi:hypothetical protein